MKPQQKSNRNIVGFEQANYQRAIQEVKKTSNRYYKGEQVSLIPELSHFKMYGAGIYLFFSFLKHAIFLFIILTIISIIPIALNGAKGVTFRNSQNSLSVLFTRTSIGSHKYSILKTENAYQESIAYKIVNVTFDIIGCAIFLGFCLYWQKKSKKIQQHISKQIKLQSNVTVEVVEFPENVKQLQIQQFMGKFGKVTEVVGARDFTQQINISKEIYELQLQRRQLELQNVEENTKKMNQIKEQIQKLSQKLSKATDRVHKITRFYVQYENPQTRKQVLLKFQPYQNACSCCKQRPQELCVNGNDVRIVACNTEPTGVLWQNAHFTWRMRIPRYLLQIIIILGVVFGGFFFISFLNILVPPIDSDVDTSSYSFQQIKALNVTALTQAWCIQNFVLDGKNSPYFSTCNSSWTMYTTGIIISISISIIIMVLCQFIKKIVYLLAEFQRYTTRSEKSVTIMTNMFIMQLLTTTLITFLMQANIFGLSILAFWSNHVSSNDLRNNIVSMNEYSDLIPRWYKDIGYQIWFNIFIMIFLPQLTQPISYYLYEKLYNCMGKRQLVHKKMVSWLQSFQFQVESHYTNILVIVATGFIFGGGIPLMMVVVLICLFIRYFYWRYIFVRFSKVPNQFNGVLNDRMILIMKVILIIRCLISIYMYGADDVFAMEKSAFMQWSTSLGIPVFSSIFIILSRFALTWYYTVFVILFILVLIFKDFIMRGVRRFQKWRKQKSQQSTTINPVVNKTETQMVNATKSGNNSQQIDQSSIQSWASNENQQINSQREVLKSYKLSSNPLYEQFLAIMNIKALVNYSMNQGLDITDQQIPNPNPNESLNLKSSKLPYINPKN